MEEVNKPVTPPPSPIQPGHEGLAQAPLPPKKTSALKKLLIPIVVLLVLAISAGTYYFLTNKNTATTNTKSQKAETTKGLSKTGFTIPNAMNGKIYVYYLEADKVSSEPLENVTSGSYGGASGLGSQDIFDSPDRTMSALIDSKTANLFLIKYSEGNAKQITNHGEVEYITGWTKDSKKIVYYRTENFDAIGNGNSAPKESDGFYIYNVDTGKESKLNGVKYVEAIASDKILVKDGDQFALYDIAKGTKDTSPFEANYEKGGFFHQIDLNPDASKWTFTYASSNENSANIYYVAIGKKTGDKIAAGSFAQVQFPQLSPDYSKIFYKDSTSSVVFDIKTKKIIATAQGSGKWIDNSKILLVESIDKSEYKNYVIWDIEKNEFKKDITKKLPSSAYEVVNTNIFPEEFKKRRFDINETASKYISLPKEFLSAYDDSLVGLTCNYFTYKSGIWNYTSHYSNGSDFKEHRVTDQNLAKIIDLTSDLTTYEGGEAKANDGATVCKLEDGRYYIERGLEDNDSISTKDHMFIFDKSVLSHIDSIDTNNFYDRCSILQIDKNGDYYYSCGGGDAGSSWVHVDKLTPGKERETIFSCNFGGEDECVNGQFPKVEQN